MLAILKLWFTIALRIASFKKAGLVRFSVDGNSMWPTLVHGDQILVDVEAYTPDKQPSRSDVVVLMDPGQPGVHCVKRIIGLPDEYIRVNNSFMMVNEEQLYEPYIKKTPDLPKSSPTQWITAKGEFIVLGDFRNDSRDSRAFGPVDYSLIIGKVLLKYWPITKSTQPS